MGIGNQWLFLVDVMMRWKALPPADRDAVMQDAEGWAFAAWLDKVPKATRRAMRHALLFLLFPETFERVIALPHKQEFYNRYRDRLPQGADPHAAAPNDFSGLDKALLAIRRHLVREHGTDQLDIYLPPLDRPAPEPTLPLPPSIPAEAASQVPAAEQDSPPLPDQADLFVEPEEIDALHQLLQRKRNLILHGPPGTGKTFVARRLAQQLAGSAGRVTMMQFHQSVGYEDFIQGWRADGTGFSLRDGRFKQVCAAAAQTPSLPHVMLIDEIKRGNLSRIFGETLMLIEADKRGPGNAIDLAGTGEKFFVPENLFVIGMMNTADRSLAVVDYALRRRFAFHAMRPRFDSPRFRTLLNANGVPEALIDRIVARLPALNRMIAEDIATLGPGFAIGHSFFCTLPGDDPDLWYEQVVEGELRPLLEEYWFDRPEKAQEAIRALLAE